MCVVMMTAKVGKRHGPITDEGTSLNNNALYFILNYKFHDRMKNMKIIIFW
jgi:hypothetical protein